MVLVVSVYNTYLWGVVMATKGPARVIDPRQRLVALFRLLRCELFLFFAVARVDVVWS